MRNQDDATPLPDEVRTELARIVKSQLFENCATQSKLLEIAVENTLAGGSISEVDITPNGFNADSNKGRSNASLVRGKLRAYYETDGKNDPVKIVLLPGAGYRAKFTYLGSVEINDVFERAVFHQEDLSLEALEIADKHFDKASELDMPYQVDLQCQSGVNESGAGIDTKQYSDLCEAIRPHRDEGFFFEIEGDGVSIKFKNDPKICMARSETDMTFALLLNLMGVRLNLAKDRRNRSVSYAREAAFSDPSFRWFAYMMEGINALFLLKGSESENLMGMALAEDVEKVKANGWYYLYSALVGEIHEVFQFLHRRRKLNRFDTNTNLALGFLYYLHREYDDAARYCRDACNRNGEGNDLYKLLMSLIVMAWDTETSDKKPVLLTMTPFWIWPENAFTLVHSMKREPFDPYRYDDQACRRYYGSKKGDGNKKDDLSFIRVPGIVAFALSHIEGVEKAKAWWNESIYAPTLEISPLQMAIAHMAFGEFEKADASFQESMKEKDISLYLYEHHMPLFDSLIEATGTRYLIRSIEWQEERRKTRLAIERHRELWAKRGSKDD